MQYIGATNNSQKAFRKQCVYWNSLLYYPSSLRSCAHRWSPSRIIFSRTVQSLASFITSHLRYNNVVSEYSESFTNGSQYALLGSGSMSRHAACHDFEYRISHDPQRDTVAGLRTPKLQDKVWSSTPRLGSSCSMPSSWDRCSSVCQTTHPELLVVEAVYFSLNWLGTAARN